MTEKSFEVPGPLLGFNGFRGSRFSRAYSDFKKLVRLLANLAGVPSTCPPGVELEVTARWSNRPRLDLDNLLKSVTDGLWSADRKVSKIIAWHEPNSKAESARVTVRW